MAEMKESVDFTFSGETVKVPVITFWDLEILQPEIELLGPELTNVSYSNLVFRIIGHLLEPDDEEAKSQRILAIKKRCSIKDMLDLPSQMSKLLSASGFITSGEAQAAQSGNGTGTSTDASPSLPFEEFAVETRDASSVN